MLWTIEEQPMGSSFRSIRSSTWRNVRTKALLEAREDVKESETSDDVVKVNVMTAAVGLAQRRTDALTVERPSSITFSSLRLFHLHPLMSCLLPGHCSPGGHLAAGWAPEHITFQPFTEKPAPRRARGQWT